MTVSGLTFFSNSSSLSYTNAIPPVIPAPKLSPMVPNIIILPPVIYSQPLDPQPSTTDIAPEFLTANRSPAWPAANRFPEVAPYSTVLPMMVFSFDIKLLSSLNLIEIVAPDKPLAT